MSNVSIVAVLMLSLVGCQSSHLNEMTNNEVNKNQVVQITNYKLEYSELFIVESIKQQQFSTEDNNPIVKSFDIK
jgi:hypothetical protein